MEYKIRDTCISHDLACQKFNKNTSSNYCEKRGRIIRTASLWSKGKRLNENRLIANMWMINGDIE